MITYSESLKNNSDIYDLYFSLEWAQYLDISEDNLVEAMKGSWYVLYAYEGDKLVGTGRVISDGIINAYVCGLGVDEDYRGKGIGTELFDRLVKKGRESNLQIQLLCEEELIEYYTRKGFRVLGAGMHI